MSGIRVRTTSVASTTKVVPKLCGISLLFQFNHKTEGSPDAYADQSKRGRLVLSNSTSTRVVSPLSIAQLLFAFRKN
ncbi:hypothetical protein V3C99_010359 [Haemonchus contortus]